MATKKMQKAQKKVEKAKHQLATEREVALKYEKVGDWSSAFDCWARIARTTKNSAEKKEAAGRAAAAKVRAQAKTTQSVPLDDQLAESKTADANARSWDSAMPEPGYVPPGGAGDEGAPGRDDAADDDGADDDADDATRAPTSEPAAHDAAPSKPARAPGERDPRLPAVGTVIVKKDRQGNERARCTIVHDGVEYRGTTYRSISAAAMVAAKDLGLASKTQDGYAFFGLKKGAPRSAKRDTVGSLKKSWERYRDRVAVAAQIADDAERARVREAIHQHVTALLALAGEATA